jgi:hypothetical protein
VETSPRGLRWAEETSPSALTWREDAAKTAVKTAPSEPYPTDEYGATNRHLWEACLDVASGEKREYTQSDRTIHSPNDGRGYRNMPANPNGIAWAVKQYNGFGGAWKPNREASELPAELRVLAQGGVVLGAQEQLGGLEEQGLVRLAGQSEAGGFWEATRKGRRVFVAALVDDLSRRMERLLSAFDPEDAKTLAVWILDNFRIDSPKTPAGGKAIKEKMSRLVWVLKNRHSSTKDPDVVKIVAEIRGDWEDVSQNLALLTKFTDEGGSVVPKEWNHGGVLYLNEIGATEKTFEKYVKRLAGIFTSLAGWRGKALKGQLTVVLKPPEEFKRKGKGTSTGRYVRESDQMWIRATPNVLGRASGYASFEYILVHELAHRYERYHPLPLDFDRPEWWTTRYSRDEGESFAELFALGHFKYTGTWDQSRVERFESTMTGKQEAAA